MDQFWPRVPGRPTASPCACPLPSRVRTPRGSLSPDHADAASGSPRGAARVA